MLPLVPWPATGIHRQAATVSVPTMSNSARSHMRERTSRVVLMEKPNEPLQIREVAIPELKDGCILVRTVASGVCGTDVHCWRGQVKMPLPVILGHESVGVIEALGPGRTQ